MTPHQLISATLAVSLACVGSSLAQAPAASAAPAVPPAAPPPFAQLHNALPNGVEARHIAFDSANPTNYEDIIARRAMPTVRLEAKLYLPKAATGKAGAVIITPGSGGVSPAMVAHAQALVDAGIAVLLVDPFGGRGVVSTVAAQDQFSFAASTYDIFAAMKVLAREPAVDANRIGAMGYSRGGISVLHAAVTPLAQAALGGAAPLRAVLAGWSWCGYQFAEPVTAPTSVRYVSGDIDDYVSASQCQGYAGMMKARNPDVSFRLVRDARHGFGYAAPLRELPQAIKALNAPAAQFGGDGVLQNPWTQVPMPGADDRAIIRMFMPFITRGANVGSKDNQAADFTTDFVAYFSAKLK